MSLTFGTGPFASHSAGAFNFDPPRTRVAYVEPWRRRMRAVFAGETVLDSSGGKLLYETDSLPLHYYPLADLREDFLVPVEPGRRWSLRVGDRVSEGAVTAPPAGDDPVAEALGGHVTVDYAAMDRWFAPVTQ